MAHVEDDDIPLRHHRRVSGKRLCTYSVDGQNCRRPHYSKGLCQAHYMRWYRKLPLGPIEVGESKRPKMSDARVLVIRRRVKSGKWTRREAARIHSVCYSTICDMVRGATYKHVPME